MNIPSFNNVQVFPNHGRDVPFRGPAGSEYLKREELEQAEITYDAHVIVLDTSKDEDMIKYRKISSLVAKGQAMISREEIEFIAEEKKWLILLRYLVAYEELSKTTKQQTNSLRGETLQHIQ